MLRDLAQRLCNQSISHAFSSAAQLPSSFGQLRLQVFLSVDDTCMGSWMEKQYMLMREAKSKADGSV